jgi:hypothetical protein
MRAAEVPAVVAAQAAAPAAQGVLAAVPDVLAAVLVAAAARDVVPRHEAAPAKVAQGAAAGQPVQDVTAADGAGARALPQAAVSAAATLASPTPNAG